MTDARNAPPGANPGTDAVVSPDTELRLSLVLYGGVSLAIYMNGVCQELLNVVKATSDRAADDAHVNRGQLYQQYRVAAAVSAGEVAAKYETFFKEQGSHIDRDDDDAIEQLLTDRDVRRRVIIDVLSGSSAGGLNAIFLARALRHNGDLESFTKLMVETGDFLTLLNDREDDELRPTKSDGEYLPKSLLNGDMFYRLMLQALADQSNEGESLVDALDCFMTMTDLRGVPTDEARLSDDTRVDELQRRAIAHLQFGNVDGYGADRDDLFGGFGTDSDIEPFLAFVGRATAAHPAAFHPAQLRQVAGLIEGTVPFDPVDPRWASLVTPTYDPALLAQRWFSDGGDLDNKPFTHALEPIDDRRATIPVERQLVYVEPDPEIVGDSWKDAAIPRFSSYTIGVRSLAGTEGIVDDLRRVEDRNSVARRLRDSLDDLRRQRLDDPNDALDRWLNDDPPAESWIQEDVPADRLAYELERARGVLEGLVSWILDLTGMNTDPATRADVLNRVRSVLDLPGDQDLVDRHRRVLVEFDLQYRLRRLNFIDQLLADAQRAGGGVHLPDVPTERLSELRGEFNSLYLRLRAADRMLSRHDHYEMRVGPWKSADSAKRVWTDLDDYRKNPPANSLDDLVLQLVGLRLAVLADVQGHTSTDARVLLKGPGCRPLAKAWFDFDVYDIHLLPRYGAIQGELSQIECTRFSPIDATAMRPFGQLQNKLGGAAFHHFGGFFDERWRLNDVMWGRLDAAELIISKLLLPRVEGEPPAIERVRSRLVERAQLAIIDESDKAIEAIADLMHDDEFIRRGMDATQLRPYLSQKFSLDLSVANNARRNETRRELLRRGSRVLGSALALSNDDPWNASPERQKKMAEKAARAGQTAGSLFQLAVPASWLPKITRWVLLPLLVVGSIYGLFEAYSPDHRLWMLTPVAGLLVAIALTFLAKAIDDVPPSWPHNFALACRLLRVLLLGFALAWPVARRGLAPEARAWFYTLQFVGLSVAVGVVLLLAKDRLLNRVWVVMLCVGAAGALVGAIVERAETTATVLAELMLGLVAACMYVGLAAAQQAIDGLAEPAPTVHGPRPNVAPSVDEQKQPSTRGARA